MRHTLDETILLTDRLLQLARIKARHGEDKPMARVDLAAIVREACFSRYPAARTRQLDLGYEGEECHKVVGDGVLLGELCANLLDNAIKYTPHNGVVTARVTPGKLEIEDSGPGIEDASQAKALQPFQRLDNVGMQPGAGIGLALVQDICAWHGATMQLDRSPQLGGLRVTVLFTSVAG
jgi:two-component system sensor histidine kinase TctE